MKLKIKWLLIGLVSALVILLGVAYSIQLGKGGDLGVRAILSSQLYESLILIPAFIVYTAGLSLVIPAAAIGITGYLIEKKLIKNSLV